MSFRKHHDSSSARPVGAARLRLRPVARGLGAASLALALASCGGEDVPAPSEAGYSLMTDAVSLAPLTSMIPPSVNSSGVPSEGYLIANPFTSATDFVPPDCLGNSTTVFSGDRVQLDWHCTTPPYRVVADLSYTTEGAYAGIGFVNVVTDSDDGSSGIYLTIVPADAPCNLESPQNCVDDLPYGDNQQLPEDLFTLSSTSPSVTRTSALTMRYEDQWVPLTCDGTTSHHPNLPQGPGIRVRWNCVYRLPDGNRIGNTAAPAFWDGMVNDPDGDGVYDGYLIVNPLTDEGTIGDTVIVPFSLTSP